jgi:hypothetical protein
MRQPPWDFYPPLTDLVMLSAAHGFLMDSESFVLLDGAASRGGA